MVNPGSAATEAFPELPLAAAYQEEQASQGQPILCRYCITGHCLLQTAASMHVEVRGHGGSWLSSHWSIRRLPLAAACQEQPAFQGHGGFWAQTHWSMTRSRLAAAAAAAAEHSVLVQGQGGNRGPNHCSAARFPALAASYVQASCISQGGPRVHYHCRVVKSPLEAAVDVHSLLHSAGGSSSWRYCKKVRFPCLANSSKQMKPQSAQTDLSGCCRSQVKQSWCGAAATRVRQFHGAGIRPDCRCLSMARSHHSAGAVIGGLL